MAKKPKIDVFGRTEPAADQAAVDDNSDLDDGRIEAMGLGLSTGEVSAIEAIASEHEITRNATLRFAVRWFIKAYRAGQVDIAGFIEKPPPPKKKLRMP